jgi:hypothetical protein
MDLRCLLRMLAICGVAAFLALSAAILFITVIRFGPASPLDPLWTANYFLSVLGVDHPAIRVQRGLNEFASDAHLLLIAPESNPDVVQIRLALVYFAYPRKLSAMFCTSPGHGVIVGPTYTVPVDGILFFGAKVVNPDHYSVSIGNKLTITRQKSTSPWPSYCR